MPIRHATIAALLLGLATLAGCAAPTPPVSAAAPAPAYVAAPGVQALAERLAADLNQGDASTLSAHLDVDGILDRIQRELPGGSSREQIRQPLEKVGEQLIQRVGTDTRWRFMRLHPAPDGGAAALLRAETREAGIVYLDLYIRDENGRLVITDWFTYSAGMTLTEALLTTYRAISGADPEDQRALLVFTRAVKFNQYDLAETAYRKMSPSLQREVTVMVMRIKLAPDDEALARALTDFAKVRGTDPRYEFLMVDLYYLRKQYDRARAAVDNFAAVVGNDAALETLRANIHHVEGRHEDAIAAYRRAIALEDDYEPAYSGLLDVLIADRHHPEAVLVLRLLQSKFGYAFRQDSLDTLDGYDALRASPEFNEWRATLPP